MEPLTVLLPIALLAPIGIGVRVRRRRAADCNGTVGLGPSPDRMTTSDNPQDTFLDGVIVGYQIGRHHAEQRQETEPEQRLLDGDAEDDLEDLDGYQADDVFLAVQTYDGWDPDLDEGDEDDSEDDGWFGDPELADADHDW
jgi:hypothetical protein